MRRFVPWTIALVALVVGFSSLAVASSHQIDACASNSKGDLDWLLVLATVSRTRPPCRGP
jgi:hypothetical protein